MFEINHSKKVKYSLFIDLIDIDVFAWHNVTTKTSTKWNIAWDDCVEKRHSVFDTN